MPSRKLLFRAKRFDVEEVQERLESGELLSRHVVRHPGAVVVLPLVDREHICMIHTYRVAIDQWQLELMEETGYRAGVMTHVHTFAMSPGILDEKMHFYVARDLTPGESQRELGEQMSNRILSWSAVDRLLRDGEIIDAKTLVGLLWYLRYREHA
jgi:ADP-ribose pyrophosphatase